MVSSMQSVCGTLGIDRVDMRGKIVLIEEQHSCDVNFLVNALISNALKKNCGICFVLFHNTFSHYHKIGMRAGYNLKTLKEKGKVILVEPMEEFVCNVNTNSVDHLMPKVPNYQDLFELLKKSYNEAAKQSESVLLIIDDISHLFDFGLSLKDSMYFVRYIRSLMESQPMAQLCIVAHTYQGDLQSCVPNIACNNLKYMAHLTLITEPLTTGHSSDASGKLTVCWNIDSVRSEYHWTERMTYLYKLLDWHVKIFAPGAMTSVA